MHLIGDATITKPLNTTQIWGLPANKLKLRQRLTEDAYKYVDVMILKDGPVWRVNLYMKITFSLLSDIWFVWEHPS